MTELDVPGPPTSADPAVPRGAGLGDQAPGERYFRHPGDVVRLVLWAIVTFVLALFVSIASDTSDGLTTDLGRAASRLAEAVRELSLALAQVGAILVPLAVVIVLVVQRRWRRLGVGLLAAAAGVAVLALVDAAVGLSGQDRRGAGRRHVGGVAGLPVGLVPRGGDRGDRRREGVASPGLAAGQ